MYRDFYFSIQNYQILHLHSGVRDPSMTYTADLDHEITFLMNLKTYEDAMKHFASGLEICRSRYSDDHEKVRRTLYSIEQVKKAQKRN
jgi:hypothetical protein